MPGERKHFLRSCPLLPLGFPSKPQTPTVQLQHVCSGTAVFWLTIVRCIFISEMVKCEKNLYFEMKEVCHNLFLDMHNA
jgi:hypothetical protein